MPNGYDDFRYYPPSRPLPADGIKAKSRRGAIGETWWSHRFIDVLERLHLGGRLTRGRSYARRGQVLSLSVAPGTVTATVQGSRRQPYRVRIGVDKLPARDWARVEKAMASRAAFMAKLLAGEMPHDIEQAFSGCKLTLFPRSVRTLDMRCSCPDHQIPCKHIAAVFYLLAEKFDDDPFLIFLWRGRNKDKLINALRKRRAGAMGRAPRAPKAHIERLEDRVKDFWSAGPQLSEVRVDPRVSLGSDAQIRRLGAPPDEIGGAELAAALRRAYSAMSAGARRRS